MKRIQLGSIILIAIIAATCLFACTADEKPIPSSNNEFQNKDISDDIKGTGDSVKAKRGTLQSFTYEFGSFHEGYWEYTLEKTEPGKVHFRAIGSNGVALNVDTELDEAVLADLAAVLDANAIAAWDGFGGRNDSVLDGYSFNLVAQFENDSIVASGYEKEPKNYDEGHLAIASFLESLTY